jgi:hypothetical protein
MYSNMNMLSSAFTFTYSYSTLHSNGALQPSNFTCRGEGNASYHSIAYTHLNEVQSKGVIDEVADQLVKPTMTEGFTESMIHLM